jgi:hypothetical protein
MYVLERIVSSSVDCDDENVRQMYQELFSLHRFFIIIGND